MSRLCVDCGHEAVKHSVRCQHCKEVRELTRRKAWEAANKTERRTARARMKREKTAAQNQASPAWKKAPLVLQRDPRPVELGGFRTGAEFSLTDVQKMLSALVIEPVLMDGTEFIRHGITYVVAAGRLRKEVRRDRKLSECSS